mmetsp:Transcript_45486/g.108133  ORF Transcript_45486/g.108133 Transcript_45486/m.108133 type:complete len:263 (-) Transcript_45486:289-1077(-)
MSEPFQTSRCLPGVVFATGKTSATARTRSLSRTLPQSNWRRTSLMYSDLSLPFGPGVCSVYDNSREKSDSTSETACSKSSESRGLGSHVPACAGMSTASALSSRPQDFSADSYLPKPLVQSKFGGHASARRCRKPAQRRATWFVTARWLAVAAHLDGWLRAALKSTAKKFKADRQQCKITKRMEQNSSLQGTDSGHSSGKGTGKISRCLPKPRSPLQLPVTKELKAKFVCPRIDANACPSPLGKEFVGLLFRTPAARHHLFC